MDFFRVFKSVLEQDTAQVVICDLEHKIVYMNPVAKKRYRRDLTGESLLDCHNERSCEMIRRVVDWFGESEENNVVHTFFNEKKQTDYYMVALRDETGKLIAYYEKHELRKRDKTPFYDI